MNNNLIWHGGLIAVFSAAVLAFFQFDTQLHTEPTFNFSQSANFQIAEKVGWGALILLLSAVVLLWRKDPQGLLQAVERRMPLRRKGVFAAGLLLALILVIYPILVIGEMGVFLENTFPRLLLIAAAAGLGTALVRAVWPEYDWVEAGIGSVLLLAVSYVVGGIAYGIHNYPFSTWWSETSYFYNAYAFAAPWLDGIKLPWMHHDPFRHILQVLPFLFGAKEIWVHRLWFQFQLAASDLLLAWVIVRRISLQSKKTSRLLMLWIFVYLTQGGIYPHVLLISAVLVWGYRNDRPGQTTALVAALSILGGLSRINWIPMPALLATILYVMETSLQNNKFSAAVRYFRRPVIWGLLGSALGFAAMFWYQVNSGVNADIYSYPFTASLLWNRLLPNSSYPLGVLPAIVIAAGPLFLFAVNGFRRRREAWNASRPIVLWIIAAVLFLGGLLVSAKIGGGLNLHNLDAFMISLLLVGVYLYAGNIDSGSHEHQPVIPFVRAYFGLILIPVLFVLFQGGQAERLDHSLARQSLAQLQQIIDDTSADGQEVLFISQRHLIPMDMVKNVSLYPEYEKIILMEAAIAGVDSYLADFEQDLEAQKFSLIVTDTLSKLKSDPSAVEKGEENNAYVVNVESLLRCYYKPLLKLPVGGVELLVPRNRSCK